MSITEFNIESTENRRILLATDLHNCHEVYHGMQNDERMELLVKSLNRYYELMPYDAILCLGDYSLDHWGWREGGSCLWNPPVSRTREFCEKHRSRFPAPSFMLPGNHEQYSDARWQELVGNPREFVVVYGGYVFAMCDTFAGNLDPSENSDGTYTGLRAEFLAEVLEAYPDKQVFICAHDIGPTLEGEDVKSLIRENPRIICAFTGHTHRARTVFAGEELRNLPFIYCGNFSQGGVAGSKKSHHGFTLLNLEKRVFAEYIPVRDIELE